MTQVIIDWIEYVRKDSQETQEGARPHKGRYWYPESDAQQYTCIDWNWLLFSNKDRSFICADTWNAFQDTQVAEKELNKRKAIVKILRYISDTYGIFEPNWNDSEQKQWIIYYSHREMCFACCYNYTAKYYSPIWHFSCEEHAQDIIDKFTPELKLIWWIE